MNSDTPTPETDDEEAYLYQKGFYMGYDETRQAYEFARKLERERDALREALKEISDHSNNRYEPDESLRIIYNIADAALNPTPIRAKVEEIEVRAGEKKDSTRYKLLSNLIDKFEGQATLAAGKAAWVESRKDEPEVSFHTLHTERANVWQFCADCIKEIAAYGGGSATTTASTLNTDD